MPDRIFIDNLRLKCRVGVTEKERMASQEILVNVGITLGLGRAGSSDDLGDTVDYRETMERISQFVSEGEFKLLESIAGGIASLVLKTTHAEKVTVKVRKAKYSDEPSIGIEIERGR